MAASVDHDVTPRLARSEADASPLNISAHIKEKSMDGKMDGKNI
jgi:hypothetical protein